MSVAPTRIQPFIKADDGAQAGRFLQEFKKLLENPVTLLTV